MTWSPATDAETREMLAAIGVGSIDELFAHIPAGLRVASWDLPAGLSEMAVRDRLARLASHNNVCLVNFMGGGVYDHFVPAAVDALTSRSEFYTAYTPYQPECSQGTLQAIYEYQSAICRLTGMDFANASLYDGSTAVFEVARRASLLAEPDSSASGRDARRQPRSRYRRRRRPNGCCMRSCAVA